MRHKKFLITAIRIGVVISILITAIVAVAQDTSLPTYRYYGQELSPQEMIERAEKGVALYCVQRLTEYALLNKQADLFECFDTAEESQAFSDAMRPANRRLEQAVQRQIARPSAQRGPGILVNHWALFSSTLYGGHIMNIGNGSSANHSSVWSIWRDGSPNNITITGACPFAFTYNSAQGSLVSCPFGGGGGTHSSVP